MSDIRNYVSLTAMIADSKDESEVTYAKEKFVQMITEDLTIEEHNKFAIDVICALGIRDPELFISVITAGMGEVLGNNIPQL